MKFNVENSDILMMNGSLYLFYHTDKVETPVAMVISKSYHDLNENAMSLFGDYEWAENVIEWTIRGENPIWHNLLADIYKNHHDLYSSIMITPEDDEYDKDDGEDDKEDLCDGDCDHCKSDAPNTDSDCYCDQVENENAAQPDEQPYEYVNGPAHYHGTECIENMRKLFGDEAVRWFCICNAYKYRFRDGSKPGVAAGQDEEKARWYEDYAVKMMNEQRYY